MRGDGDSVRDHIQGLVEREAPALSAQLRQELVDRVVTASTGFGPLEELLADDSVDEIMVNGHEQIWVERGGVVSPTDVAFESAVELEDLIERMIAPLGRRVDEASPICDARLPDGSRVNVVIPPLALGGPALTIRRFKHSHFDPAALVENGTLSVRAHDFLAPRRRAPDVAAGQRRHGLGQDDDAERALGLRPRERADRHDRGRGRAAPAPGPRRAPGGAPGEPGGTGGGHDPRAGADGAAHAARSHRRRRGARRRGAGHARRR